MVAPRVPALAAAQLLVVLVGVPGSGKSTFARRVIADAEAASPGARWQRVSQDVLGSRKRCISVAERALRAGDHLLIDRCNFDMSQRAHWLNLRGSADTHRIAIFHEVPRPEALRRVLERPPHEGNVDSKSMSEAKLRSIVARMQSDLRPPQLEEGFDEIHVCRSEEPETADFARRRLAALLLEAELQAAARARGSDPDAR